MLYNTSKYIFVFLATLLLVSCSKENPPDTPPGSGVETGEWLVPFEDILYFGDPPDEIVSIDDPTFIRVSESDWQPEERVYVVQHNDVVRAYPVTIMGAHEIVNDRIGDFFFTVNYCPITGSGMAWNRNVGGEVTEFGVSGMLFRENLVPYDRNTGSYWSQMRMVSIHGTRIETRAEPVPFFETDFSLIRTHYPEAEILSDSCSGLIGCRHKDATDEVAPGNSSAGLLEPGKEYFGVVREERAVVFSLDSFEAQTRIYDVSLPGKKVLVVGNQGLNFIAAFETSGLGQITFNAKDPFPIAFGDDKGNVYNIFGVVTAGPQKGEQLPPASAYRAKGFAWESIFTTVELFDNH
jgi:hypothetical protein